ncbi:PEP/pyruvate-binding domain-containing protein [Candidatus Tisiphia endosymbiont of Ceraclea dissimilis]
MAGEENNEVVDVAGGTSRYSEKIEDDAKSFGYKAANLLNLREVVKEFNELLATNQDSQLGDNIIKVQVPTFEPINGDIIKQHLDTHAPEWVNLFQEFADTYKAQSNLDTLSEASIECLKKLQECIINCFNQHELEPGLFNKFLEKNKIQPEQLLMIRSTGVHEDKADMANPGGNESLPCKANIREISQALGRVAASYVGPKSLAQRLIARDQHITDFPVMPGLIQQMIGEGMDVSQSADRQNKVPVSGVIYSKDGASRLQVAPGHGEYVVNSKGRVDNFYISTQGVVYSEIAAKDFRLQPKLDENNKKIILQRQENPAELKYQPSIASDAAYYAHQFAQYLVGKYGKRMDIEFVYNPDDHQINIVQARAIPEGSRKGLEPSAISPQFLADNKANMTTIQGLQVITPEINKVVVITEPNQVIICNTIEEALTQYNKNHDKIVGVIVQQPSPDTSHEAGVFNASAIPVMQVSDIVAVQELLKKNNHLIIDPQHSSVYQLSEAKFRELDQINIEKALYDKGIVAKGIYASSLSGYVTPINYSFSKENLSKNPVTLDKNPSIGKLANEAQAGNKLSADQLLSLAYQAMNFRLPQNVEAPSQDNAEKLRDNIAALSLPKIGESNDQAKEALGYNLRAVTDSYKKGTISADLFKQTMIAGAELSVLLDKMQHLSSHTQQQREQAYLEYFNVQKKFTGMIIGVGGKNILADSLAISLKQNKYAKQAEELINKFLPDGTATDKQKAYLTESIKLADYFLSKEKQQEWLQFCGKICTARTDDNKLNELPAERLGKLVNQLVSLGVHQQWLNLIFTADNKPEHSLQTLNKLEQDFKDIDLSKIQKAKATIDSMQAQIPQWSDPAKFSELFKGLQENISNLNRQLKWNSQASNLEKILILEQVNQLTDILDKSTKSLERSTLYPDNAKDKNGNDLQVAHFKDMVGEFYDLMKVWVAEGKFKGDELAQNSLEEIIRSFQVQGKQILTKNQFNPSPYFSVNRATINITGDRTIPDTLEDILTLIHQNMIVVITDLATETNKILYQQLPNLVKNLDIAFNNELLDSSNPYYSDRISNLSTMISLKNQTLIIEKNIPLRAHSCIASIKYNVKDGAFVKFTMLGFNEQNRWDNITLDTYLQFTKAGIEFVIPPRHDKEKGIFEYEIKIKEEQIESLIDMINKSIDISYKLSVENKPQASEVKQELLVDRLDLLSKFSNAELNKVANMAKIILMEPEQFGQFELLGDSNLERLTTLFQFCNKNELVRAVIGNLGSLAEKLPNLYIDNILDNQETLNSSTWEFLKSKSPYNKEIFIDKLFALQNSADDKSLNLFKDILIQG